MPGSFCRTPCMHCFPYTFRNSVKFSFQFRQFQSRGHSALGTLLAASLACPKLHTLGGIPLAVRWYSRRLGGGFRKGWADVARLGRLTDGVCILRVKLLFLLRESGMFLSYSWFFAYPAGAKTTFSFAYKRKSGSGLRKRKGRPVEILGWYGTTG